MSDDQRPTPASPEARPSGDAPKALSRIEASATFEGPIPHPALLQGYDELVPGAADRLIRMAEDQAAHEREMESKALGSDIKDRESARREALVGQLFGLTIGLAAIVGATLAAVNGAQWFGAALGVGGIAGLVGVFVYGRRHKEDDPSG